MDIYLENRIYTGLSRIVPLSAAIPLIEEVKDYTSYPVQGTHNFKDGQQVVHSVDYEFKENFGRLSMDNSPFEHVAVTVAVPLPIPIPTNEPSSGEAVKQESYYYPLFKFFNEEHNLVLLESEIQEIIHQVNQFNYKL